MDKMNTTLPESNALPSYAKKEYKVIVGLSYEQQVKELTDQLAAANKAIVALADQLDRIRLTGYASTVDEKPHFIAAKALGIHAPAIEKARGE